MRDLELWAGEPTAAMLREVAAWTPARRAPYFGKLLVLSAHDDIEIRTAAIAALGGSRGVVGVRAIVRGLADEATFQAAIEALKLTVREGAHDRYVHAIFHPDLRVRRASLIDMPSAANHLAVYLRADPECADLTEHTAWPRHPLPLGFDLFVAGRLSPAEFLDVVIRVSADELRVFLEREVRRSAEQVDAYLAAAVTGPLAAPAGRDLLDRIAGAVMSTIDEPAAKDPQLPWRVLESLVEAASEKKATALLRRTVVALLGALFPARAESDTALVRDLSEASNERSQSYRDHAPPEGEPAPRVRDLSEARDETSRSYRDSAPPERQSVARKDRGPDTAGAGALGLLEAAIALEPRLLEYAALRALDAREGASCVARGLFRYKWPIKPPKPIVERLLKLPFVRGDLAVAVAVVALGSPRMKRLAKLLGESEIVSRLVDSDRGWDEICKLPPEAKSLELAWLAKVEKLSTERYVALAGRALGVLRDKRLASFAEQIPRRHRSAVFLALANRADLSAEDPRLVSAATALAPRLDRGGATEVLEALLADARVAVARTLCRELTDKQLGSAAYGLTDDALVRLVEAIEEPHALPRDREVALATAIAVRSHPVLGNWSARILMPTASDAKVVKPPVGRVLDESERHRIEMCSDAELEKALVPALVSPASGLVPALAARTEMHSVAACAALIACTDPPELVARELDRFVEWTDKFATRLDHHVTARWNDAPELPALAHARLYRWEAHTEVLAEWVQGTGGVLPALMFANALPGRLATETLWRGIAELVVLWRYRDSGRLRLEASTDLARYCASRIDRPVGKAAARIVVTLIEGKLIGLSAIKDAILERTADADAETRELLARLIRLDGMPEPPKPVDANIPTAALLDQIRVCRDIPGLLRWCGDPRTAVVQEAVLALLLLGEQAQIRLAALLAELEQLPNPVPILASIGLWDSKHAVFAARELAARGKLRPQWQFHLCLGLGDIDGALAAARVPGDGWFRRPDWDALIAAAPVERCAIALADAPHHHAYQPAIAVLLDQPGSFDVRDALVRFLETGDNRPLHLRRSVARLLLARYDVDRGLPIMIEEIAEATPATVSEPTGLLDGFSGERARTIARAIVDAALIGGHAACSEKRMLAVLERLGCFFAPAELGDVYMRVLEHASDSATRRHASAQVVTAAMTGERLAKVAQVFAWGIRRGVELTGRLFRIHLTSKETELGYTHLDSNRLFVSPLPLLRGEPHGQDIVEGLLLHEIGHHVYHRGEQPQALWKQAHKEGIGHLLNLIADEHLERNLRGVDRAYGDRLKRLDAFAFQHGAHEIQVAVLLSNLRGAAFTALSATPLEVAFDEGSVRLRRGAVLTELDRTGHPLARFCRALRMGLGNRHDDPLVGRALELCGANLRKLDMQGLYDLTVKIAELFGGACSIAQIFGGSEGIGHGERDDDVFGGLDDDILQREVERILDPRRNKSGASSGGVDRLCINVNPDEEFDNITHVERIQGDPVRHREIAREVARHSHRLRAYLDDLGLRWEPQHARIQGRALDRTRLRALVTRNDPKILMAREPRRRTDLFLGTIVDCSGSMTAGNNIERAKRFAVLVAEAVQALPGVEARFFGFTDSEIYDAGDARDCNVVGLEAGGGNNDAAALLHVANVAASSQKRAKVLVMISDGLPTECSVAALRGLVTQLTRRRGMVCAQVAVRKLEEECFPHHVLLDDSEPDTAVARFGRMIADLARRSLAG